MHNNLNLSINAVDQRLTIRKLLSADYNTYNRALHHGGH